jgi:putative membrane protein
MTAKRVVMIVVGLLFASFVAQNAEVVEVRFLFFKAEASRAIVLLGTFVFGILAGWLTGWMRKHEKKEQPDKPAGESS